jgi:hypothetical protein
MMLRLLRAYTWHYRQARRWHFLKILGMLLLAAAAPVVTFWFPAAADGVAAAAGAWHSNGPSDGGTGCCAGSQPCSPTGPG